MIAELRASLRFHLRWCLSNLALRPGRNLLAAAGIAIALAIFLGSEGFQTGYQRSLNRSIEQLGFEVLVTAKGCPYEAATLFLRGGSIPMYLDESLCRAISEDPAVKASSRLFLQTVEGRRGVYQFVLGVEDSFRAMKPWLELQVGRWMDSAEDEVVLGYNVATELAIAPGDTWSPAGLHSSFRVVGILDRTGTQDDGTVFLPLERAQRLFDRKNKVTGVGVKVQDVDMLPDYLTRVYELPGVQVVTLSQTRGVLLNLVGTARKLLSALGLLALLISALSLVNTLLMSLMERRREMAVLRAIGAPARVLLISLLLEAQLLCLAGAALGVALIFAGSGLVDAFLRWTLPFAPPGALVVLNGGSVASAFLVAAALGLLAAAYPAFVSAMVRPIHALRTD